MRRIWLAFIALLFALPAYAAGDLAVRPVTVTIANGASLSGAVDLGPNRLFAIIMPAAWTTANLTFQVSADGTTYNNLYDDTGTEVTVTAAASQYIVISSPAKMLGARWFKVRSGTNASAVNQAAARVVTIVGVP